MSPASRDRRPAGTDDRADPVSSDRTTGVLRAVSSSAGEPGQLRVRPGSDHVQNATGGGEIVRIDVRQIRDATAAVAAAAA